MRPADEAGEAPLARRGQSSAPFARRRRSRISSSALLRFSCPSLSLSLSISPPLPPLLRFDSSVVSRVSSDSDRQACRGWARARQPRRNPSRARVLSRVHSPEIVPGPAQARSRPEFRAGPNFGSPTPDPDGLPRHRERREGKRKK